MKKASREHLEQFGSSGLRTLCLAYRNLNSDVYETWNEKFIQAKSSLRDREKKLDEVLFILFEFIGYFYDLVKLLMGVDLFQVNRSMQF